MSDTVRALFRCQSVKMYTEKPYSVQRNFGPGEPVQDVLTWPRTFEFQAQYDESVPEEQRYARATPSGTITMTVDNPAVSFRPGTLYVLEFTEMS